MNAKEQVQGIRYGSISMTQASLPKPAISVIVPVYNVVDHVEACIASLRAQIWTDFEVIIVDDGATDGSGEAATRACAGDPRFRIVHQENRGLSGARNVGLDQAKGAFIAFVDSDDRVTPDYLSRLHDALETSGADWVACAVRSCFADGTSHVHSAIHTSPHPDHASGARRYRFADWSDVIAHFPSAWNKLYRRELLEGVRFDEGTWFEDHSFFARASLRTDRLLHLPEPLYLQTRDRSGQITSQDDDRVFEQFDVLRRMHDIMRQSPRDGADAAFARLASRLLFERSVALRTPDRRARFAQAAGEFMQQQGLEATLEHDAQIGQSWALEMAGELPLSVVVNWAGEAETAVRETLSGLELQHGPGREVLILCASVQQAEAQAIVAEFPGSRVLIRSGHHAADGWNQGLDAARGRFVVFLRPGAVLRPVCLHDWTESMLRHKGELGLAQFEMRPADAESDPIPHNGFADMRALPEGTPASGPLTLTPQMALALAPELSARIFKRDFLLDQGLRFTRTARGGWALGLGAALMAQQVVYTAWAGVSVPEASGDTGAVARGHDAFVRRLPAPARKRLPEGWQRRMFDRALREEIRYGAAQGGWRKRMLLANAMLSATLRGLSGATPRKAGFDSAFGPRSALLLDPVSLMRVLIRRPRSGTLAQNQSDLDSALNMSEDAVDHFQMLFFPFRDQGLFRFRANFRETPYANLFFLASDRRTCPFHLSLRLEENLAVCNHRDAGGQWGRERRKPVAISAIEASDVVVTLTPQSVCVTLDGQEIFRLGLHSLMHRSGIRDLDTITHLDMQGGVQPLDVIPETGTGDLFLDQRLQLRAGGRADAHRLIELGGGLELPLIPSLSADGRPALQALLGGRVWENVAQDTPLRLQLATRAGAPVGQVLEISRADMTARLTTVLRQKPTTADSALILLLFEHLRHANLLPHIAPDCHMRLQKLAEFYGLEAFLFDAVGEEEDDDTTAPDALKDVTPAPDVAMLDDALARFTCSQQQSPAPAPLQVLAELSLPRHNRQTLYLILAEFFCRHGQDFDGLFAMAEEAKLPAYQRNGTSWNDTAVLPFLFLQGDLEDVCAQMQALAQPSDDWITTPNVAWVVRRALSSTDLPEEQRERIFYAFMEIVEQRSRDYWERAHCQELTGAAVALLLERDHTSYYLRGDVTEFCLRNYAMSRQFWTLLEARRPAETALPPKVAEAQHYFTMLSDPAATLATIESALSFFDKVGCHDAPRMRHELLGPAGVTLETGATLDMPALLKTHPHPAQAALRHMATPASAPVSRDVSDLVSDCIADLYSELPRAPYFELQAKTARDIGAILANPSETVPDPHLKQVLRNCACLAARPSGFLGLALGCALITGLSASESQRDTVASVADWILARIDGLDEAERETLCKAPAVRMALVTMRARGVDPVLCDRLEAALLAGGDPLPSLPDAGLLDLAASPLYDTIVTVFSCKPNLETRIPAMRAGWLNLLSAMGVPYVVVVGDGDGTRHGDIVHLDAPDDYEGLPLKTLATIRWVHDNTACTHMLKIDDDCFLNAPLFFASLSYRKFDYYGRRLTRVIGQMDRSWHQGKSTSSRGRMELDKSPEPSNYADGGSGYTLSRTAMAAALDVADSPEGQQLIQVSFMEDKMLGDLLALRDIHVEDEDYRTAVRRRTYSTAIPVASWQNGFDASRTAPVHMVHMDTHLGQAEMVQKLDQQGLWPRKIWPSYQQARLGYRTNALELVSSEASVQAAQEAPVALVACMRNEMFMLPQFLDHYRRLGVAAFLIADNCSDDGTLEYLAEQPDVALFSVDTDYRLSRYGVAWQQAMMAAFRVGKWSIVADADEFLTWQRQQTQTLPELLATPEFETADAARIFMLDMYPKGPLEEATFKTNPFAEAGYCDSTPFLNHMPTFGPYSDRPTWTSALRHRLIPGSRPNLFVAQKLALLRYQPWMRLSAGLHYVGDVKLSSRELLFAHFKYNADFRRKAQSEVARGQHFNDAEEYRKYLALMSEGRDVIYEEGLSVPWKEAPFVRALLRE